MATQRIILPVQSAKIVGSTVDGLSYIDNPAGIDGGQNTWALLFDASTDESALWSFQVPGNYTGSPSVNIQYTMASAVANDIDMRIDTKAISSGNPNSTSVTGFSTETSFTETVPSSAGFISEIAAAISTAGIAADRFMVLRLSRQTTSANDTAAGDVEVRALTMEYST
jgi:hypothetical protein